MLAVVGAGVLLLGAWRRVVAVAGLGVVLLAETLARIHAGFVGAAEVVVVAGVVCGVCVVAAGGRQMRVAARVQAGVAMVVAVVAISGLVGAPRADWLSRFALERRELAPMATQATGWPWAGVTPEAFVAAMLPAGTSAREIYRLDLAMLPAQPVVRARTRGVGAVGAAGVGRDVGTMRLAAGGVGVLRQGTRVAVFDAASGQLVAEIAKTDKLGIGTSRLAITDLDANGIDEVAIFRPHPMVVEPRSNGTWRVLVRGGDEEWLSVRGRTILARTGERLRAYTYSRRASSTRGASGELVRRWEIRSPGLKDAWLLEGGRLAATFDGDTESYVWRPHGVPVRMVLVVGGVGVVLAVWMFRRRGVKTAVGILLMASLLASCARVYSSGASEAGDSVARPWDATGLLRRVIAESARGSTEGFWMSGYVRTQVGRQTVSAMLDGVASGGTDGAYVLHGRIAGRGFELMRDTGARAMWAGYESWLPFAGTAWRLPDADVLGVRCAVVQLRLRGSDWLQFAGAGSQGVDSVASAAAVATETEVKVTLYVDEVRARVIQQSAWLVMPMPGEGAVDQEVFWRFYKFGDPAIPGILDAARQ
jgi:hypothetical protein